MAMIKLYINSKNIRGGWMNISSYPNPHKLIRA